jgi:hypothetical protein
MAPAIRRHERQFLSNHHIVDINAAIKSGYTKQYSVITI